MTSSRPIDTSIITKVPYDLGGRHVSIGLLEAEGVIGKMADTNYSFMGFIRRPDLLVSDTATQVAQLLKGDGVDAAVLTST